VTLRPCIGCGLPTPLTRCPECRGYDHAWDRLSRRARRLQPFCSDCGATEDLQTDHTPEAWARKAAGKPIRLQDIDVVCQDCNIARGAARPESLQHNRSRQRGQREKRCRTTADGGGMPLTSTDPRRPRAKFALHTADWRQQLLLTHPRKPYRPPCGGFWIVVVLGLHGMPNAWGVVAHRVVSLLDDFEDTVIQELVLVLIFVWSSAACIRLAALIQPYHKSHIGSLS
jgi:5-methylcytosine-specific restriction protein A